MSDKRLPPGQQLVGSGKWPFVGERSASPDVPSPDVPSPWSLRLTEGTRSEVLTLDEINSWAPEDFTVDIHCVTRWSRLDSRFRGVSLQKIVERFRPSPAAGFVSFVAHTERRHHSSLPLQDALNLGVFLATHFEETPLTPTHGGPLRSVAPGRYFYKSVKWLAALEFLGEDRLGYWEGEAGYHNEGDPWKEQRFVAGSFDRKLAWQLLASKNLDGRNILGLEAAKRDLQDLSAEDALLRNANFQGADLRGANFCRANLSGANLRQADLRNATFQNGDVEGADFSGADLRGTDFRGASLFGASFIDEKTGDQAILNATSQIADEDRDALCPAQYEYVRKRMSSDT
jgi:DMSO/TMAO reductase YedYZ molybdopterin-dependent catalytic subunit